MGKDGATAIFVGRSTLDVVYDCPAFPEPDGKVDARASYITSGGPALNAAVAFAGLGGRARLSTAIGAGLLADWVRQDLTSYGVEIFDSAEGAPDALPVSSILLTGASRAIVNQPLPVRSHEMGEAMLQRLFEARPKVVLSDGHLPELAAPVLRRARELGVPTVLDGGSWKPWTAELLGWIDVAVVSSRFRPPPEAGVSDALALLRKTIGAVAVTNGAEPIRWSLDGQAGEIRPPEVAAVDTLGAGDIFHGVFCRHFAASGDFVSSLQAAAQLASRSCASFGPRSWIASVGANA